MIRVAQKQIRYFMMISVEDFGFMRLIVSFLVDSLFLGSVHGRGSGSRCENLCVNLIDCYLKLQVSVYKYCTIYL